MSFFYKAYERRQVCTFRSSLLAARISSLFSSSSLRIVWRASTRSADGMSWDSSNDALAAFAMDSAVVFCEAMGEMGLCRVDRVIAYVKSIGIHSGDKIR